MKKWILLCLALTATTFAQRDIEKFSENELGEADEFIKAEFGDELKIVSPSSVKDGLFFLRQKFEDPFDDTQVNYQVYQGVSTSESIELSKFEIKGMTPEQVAKTKFYSAADEDASFDIEKVYIDGNHVLIEFGDELAYWKDGKAVVLKASQEKPYSVSIKSTPSAAKININGSDRGVAPVNFKQTGNVSLVITVSKDGFYPKQIIKNANGQNIDVSVNLVKTIALANPVGELKIRVKQISGGAEQEVITDLKGQFAKAKSKIESSFKNAEAHAKTNFPVVLGKQSKESPAAFAKRKETWNTEKANFMNTLKATKAQLLADLEVGNKKLASIKVIVPEPEVVEAEEEYAEEEMEEEAEEEQDLAEASEEIYEEEIEEEEEEDFDVSNRFSASDEYIKWTGWSLIGIGAVSLVPATLQYLEFNKANTSIDDTKAYVENAYSLDPNLLSEDQIADNRQKRAYYETVIISNLESTRDTYKNQFMLWTVLSGITIGTGSVLLFAF
jgi:flagellar biosynthesis GTPase FlhF